MDKLSVMETFPKLQRLKYPQAITIKVNQEVKDLYHFVRNNGLDAAEIFRVSGTTGLEKARTYLASQQDESA